MPGNRKLQSTEKTTFDLSTATGGPISSRTRSSKATSSTAYLVRKSGGKHTNCTIPQSGAIQASSTRFARKSAPVKHSGSSNHTPTAHSKLQTTVRDHSGGDGSPQKTCDSTMAYFKSRPDRKIQHRGRHLQDDDEPMPLARAPAKKEAETCVVCMCPPDDPKKLDKCGHIFCKACIDQCFSKMNPVCPICGTVYGTMVGNMPRGTMHTHMDHHSQLPGYHGCGTIVIEYNFANGTQTSEHAHPGRMYHGTHRVAYLPNNAEGNKVLRLLKKAFDRRMTFTVGRSATTGLDDQVVWNDIHHKTRINGGPTAFGYPDPTYLRRVQEELAAKGIVD